MKKYKVKGLYTISFEAEVEAESGEEAIEIAEDFYITESIDNCIFCADTDVDVQLYADGMIRDVEAEYIGEGDDEDDEYDEYYDDEY